MKKTMEKIVAALLVVIMLAANLPTNCVYASNEVENDVVITETEENTGGTLNYAYVESPYLETPNTQNIVVSWGDGTEEISDIRIIVSSEDGASEEWECIQSKDDSYLFSKEYTDSTEQATYQVTSFKYAQDGEQHEISMLDLNAKVEFGVNKAYEDYREYITPLDIETEGIEMSVVTIDENGQAKAQESIQAALEEVTAVNAYSAEVRNSEIVVALDPGHDDRHGGATHNGLVEQDLTLKIANYAKAELETYQGVQVYMTRTTSACPYPETDSSGKCIEQRVIAAAKVGAKIYVSIHLNATEKDTTPSGAEVIYPNSNWKSQVGADGKALAQSILDELVKLGLKDRGIYCKDSTINEKYEDGSASDYFSVQIYGKEQGIPGIIVEHAFMTNMSDVNNFLRTEEGLKSLGVADATGIAKFLGLSTDNTLYLDTASYSGEAGSIYQFLAITNDRSSEPQVTVGDSDIVSVEMYNANDSRGFLYQIQGKKPGKTIITVSHKGKTASFPVAYSEVNYTLDTKDMEYPEGNIYQFLARITDKTKGQPTVTSSDVSVAKVYLRNERDSRGYLYEIKTKKSGTAIITVNYFGTERSFILTVTEVEKYEIAGETTVKIQQMVDLFNSRNVSYPSEALSKGGARDITEFCQILCQEAASEGIRAEVVFAQSMLETGYLQFQGVVDAEQFNFAGLGATGGGEKGADFSSYGEEGVRMGLRAQIQHLKCYANKEPLNNECVDPRWQNWLRGMAPYVEWLGKQENPNEIGWATGENYGYNIKKIIYQVKEF